MPLLLQMMIIFILFICFTHCNAFSTGTHTGKSASETGATRRNPASKHLDCTETDADAFRLPIDFECELVTRQKLVAFGVNAPLDMMVSDGA